MSLDHLIVKPATDAQAHEAAVRSAAHWGTRAGVTVDEYVKFTAVMLQQGAFARDGRLTTWVLAPEDDPDTTNFYASCQVYAREVLSLQPGQTAPISSFGHGISAVLVPPEHRRKGYANRLMSLLHSALAPHRYPNPLNAPVPADYPSTVSVLYSVLGDYYSRCVPSTNESGWMIQKSMATTWLVSSTQVPLGQNHSLQVELLPESEATAVLDADDSNIPSDLIELRKTDPSKTYFAFVPTSPLNAFSVLVSKVTRGGQSNLSWGAKISGGKDFMTWRYSRQNQRLEVTRLRATTDSFPVLLNAALQTARDTGCGHVVIWNVPVHLKGIAKATGGETTERADSLSGFKWYGQESGPKTKNVDVIWALEEGYSWC